MKRLMDTKVDSCQGKQHEIHQMYSAAKLNLLKQSVILVTTVTHTVQDLLEKLDRSDLNF